MLISWHSNRSSVFIMTENSCSRPPTRVFSPHVKASCFAVWPGDLEAVLRCNVSSQSWLTSVTWPTGFCNQDALCFLVWSLLATCQSPASGNHIKEIIAYGSDIRTCIFLNAHRCITVSVWCDVIAVFCIFGSFLDCREAMMCFS